MPVKYFVVFYHAFNTGIWSFCNHYGEMYTFQHMYFKMLR